MLIYIHILELPSVKKRKRTDMEDLAILHLRLSEARRNAGDPIAQRDSIIGDSYGVNTKTFSVQSVQKLQQEYNLLLQK